MKLLAKKSALSRRFSGVPQLICWLSFFLMCGLGADSVAARNSGRLSFAKHIVVESVQTELVRLQQQTGLTLATFGFGLSVVLFDKGTLVEIPISTGTALVTASISRDGTEMIVARFDPSASDSLELLRIDGRDVRELPFARAGDVPNHVQSLCWSHDKSRLAVAVHRGSLELRLEILNLGSGVYETVDPSVKELTSQAWSFDDKRVVYEAADGVRTYEIGNGKSSTLLAPGGKRPTWSPDGNWIAYRNGDTYYKVRPDGRDKTKLLHRKDVYSPLWWSPDSRFVVYVSTARFAIDDVYELRVRRLVDDSEVQIAEEQISGDYQWLASPQLVRQAESQTKPH